MYETLRDTTRHYETLRDDVLRSYTVADDYKCLQTRMNAAKRAFACDLDGECWFYQVFQMRPARAQKRSVEALFDPIALS